MDYIEAFKNLKTNNKYSRKSPHKAILLLSVIEMYETNSLSENVILYDEELKHTFLKVWERTLKDEPLFHPEAYLPFWYMQSEDFWHIVPNRGKEDILTLLKDNHIKPSEAKLMDCVKYAELDEDLYFLMTLPSGRSSLKRVLLENYTGLQKDQIERLCEKVDNTVDFSVSALSEYEKIISNEKVVEKASALETSNELVLQFQRLSEDIQIVLNLQYFSFLKTHRKERERFKELFPTVFDLLDKVVNHPIKQGELVPSFAFIYDNFLSDLKISFMSEEGSVELIDKISEALDILRGSNKVEDDVESVVKSNEIGSSAEYIEKEFKQKIDTKIDVGDTILEREFANENRRGKSWTKDEEKQIECYYKQGKEAKTIAAIMGRTEVAIKTRLAKLGLIDYIYGQEEQLEKDGKATLEKVDESDFIIENTFSKCSIRNKYGETIFREEGKLKFILGKLYRLNLKNECFTLKSMCFNGSEWLKGEKKIVAYPQTELYRVLDRAIDYSEVVEDIIDKPFFEECRLKVKGVWYNYNGDLIKDTPNQNERIEEKLKQDIYKQRIMKSPLYAERKKAILRAMGYFRLPAKIKDIARTISRTAWGSTIKENDVEEIINTMSEVESVEGKYILRKK